MGSHTSARQYLPDSHACAAFSSSKFSPTSGILSLLLVYLRTLALALTHPLTQRTPLQVVVVAGEVIRRYASGTMTEEQEPQERHPQGELLFDTSCLLAEQMTG